MKSSRDLRVFGIARASFSGSTLLSFMLGVNDQVFATGEAWRMFRRYRRVVAADRELDCCSIHTENCDFWTPDFIEQCDNSGILDLYQRIAGYSEETSVVVHSFDAKIYEELLRERTPLDGLIVLFKRPVSFYSSHKQHEGGTVASAAAVYASVYRTIQDITERHRVPAATVFYEDLATKPEQTVQALCDWMGLTYEPLMISPWDAADRLHTIGGNVGAYMHLWDDASREKVLELPWWGEAYGERGTRWLRDNFRRIELDDRWKSLPPEEIREMEACTEAQETFDMLIARRLVPNPDRGGVAENNSNDGRSS
jgi:hypothetical protein